MYDLGTTFRQPMPASHFWNLLARDYIQCRAFGDMKARSTDRSNATSGEWWIGHTLRS